MVRIVILLIFLVWVPSASAATTAADNSWLKEIPLHDAIRVGTGNKIVVEISDPDCRFSRRMARYWALRKDVTRYIFLIALKNHPDAAQKAHYILSSPDRAAAYQQVFSGSLDFDEKLAERRYDDHGALKRHQAVAARLDVVGTPTYFLSGARVNGAKVKELEQLLGGEKVPFDVGGESPYSQ